MSCGIIILVIGIILLLENLGIISNGFWNIFWPCLIILAGISLVVKDKKIKFIKIKKD